MRSVSERTVQRDWEKARILLHQYLDGQPINLTVREFDLLHVIPQGAAFQNRNDLVRSAKWINGVKTGHTANAGYVLVGSGRRNGTRSS